MYQELQQQELADTSGDAASFVGFVEDCGVSFLPFRSHWLRMVNDVFESVLLGVASREFASSIHPNHGGWLAFRK